jgi:RNA polymerase sigma-70 factor (ECF subfamily)
VKIGVRLDRSVVMGSFTPTRQRRFEALFTAHYRDVHRFALRRTDAQSAEEVANETFAVCWRRLDSVPDPPLPWLYGVARKCLANHQRDSFRNERRERAAFGAARDTAGGRDPAERFAERDAILRALTALPEHDREALRLVAWEGLAIADAARAAGVSRPAFAMRLHRARRRLAAHLYEPEPEPNPPVEHMLEKT